MIEMRRFRAKLKLQTLRRRLGLEDVDAQISKLEEVDARLLDQISGVADRVDSLEAFEERVNELVSKEYIDDSVDAALCDLEARLESANSAFRDLSSHTDALEARLRRLLEGAGHMNSDQFDADLARYAVPAGGATH